MVDCVPIVVLDCVVAVCAGVRDCCDPIVSFPGGSTIVEEVLVVDVVLVVVVLVVVVVVVVVLVVVAVVDVLGGGVVLVVAVVVVVDVVGGGVVLVVVVVCFVVSSGGSVVLVAGCVVLVVVAGCVVLVVEGGCVVLSGPSVVLSGGFVVLSAVVCSTVVCFVVVWFAVVLSTAPAGVVLVDDCVVFFVCSRSGPPPSPSSPGSRNAYPIPETNSRIPATTIIFCIESDDIVSSLTFVWSDSAYEPSGLGKDESVLRTSQSPSAPRAKQKNRKIMNPSGGTMMSDSGRWNPKMTGRRSRRCASTKMGGAESTVVAITRPRRASDSGLKPTFRALQRWKMNIDP